MEQKKGAAIILYTPDKKILLQHRTADAPRYPNKWGCFGGGVEEGESPIEAVKRECIEELGYELVKPVHFLTKEIPSERTVYYFAERYDSSKSLTLNEGQGFGWFSIEEGLMLDFTKSVELLLQELKKQNPLF